MQGNHKQQLLKSSAFHNVLECFEIDELFKLRHVNKRIGDELVPRCFKKFRYFLPYPEDKETDNKTLYRIIKNANKVELTNINGSEDHLQRIAVVAENIGKQAKYLHLCFEGETDDENLAKLYADVFRKFEAIDTLRIDVRQDGNVTRILAEIMKDPNYTWFSSVKTLKCYDGLGLKDKSVLQLFFTKFRDLNWFKGIITEYWNPLELFPQEQKRIKSLYWSMPDNAALRETTLKFLEYNKTETLRLYGGFGDKADIPTIHPEGLKHLILRDMPSVGLKQVFAELPELLTFHVENVEDFTKEHFIEVFNKLEKYVGLQKLVMDLVQFDLEENKDLILTVLRTHAKTLRHLSLARNKVTNEFLNRICEVLAHEEDNVLEHFDLRYLKETKDINWVNILKSIATIGQKKKRNVTVTITSYQTYSMTKEIQAYLEKETPHLEINMA